MTGLTDRKESFHLCIHATRHAHLALRVLKVLGVSDKLNAHICAIAICLFAVAHIYGSESVHGVNSNRSTVARSLNCFQILVMTWSADRGHASEIQSSQQPPLEKVIDDSTRVKACLFYK